MTLDEFLDVYVPTVLKPMGGWRLDGGLVRRGDCCPLTAAAGAPSDFWVQCADEMRLGACEAADVMEAADRLFDGGLHLVPIRARLLAGLGLTEAQ